MDPQWTVVGLHYMNEWIGESRPRPSRDPLPALPIRFTIFSWDNAVDVQIDAEASDQLSNMAA